MTCKLTWLGHAAFLIESDGHTLLIDPFLTGNPMAAGSPDDLEPDHILITHGHGDHLGDTVAIAKRTGATVISNFEIVTYLQTRHDIQNVHPQHIGGAADYPWGRLKLTHALHGSALPDGTYGGNPAGLLLYLPAGRIYHAGDTGLFGDMALIGEEGIDLAILPVGDNFTMGPEDALRALKLIKPAKVIPIHYDTFDIIKQDISEWAEEVKKSRLAEPVLLKPGDRYLLG
jgi:L-ascorbate metabolism protein UlaG (beta-lactamase superfamily)